MRSSRVLNALLLAAGLSSTGCVQSYASRPPLSFQDLDYTSEDGKQPWPVKRMALPKTAAAYGMATVPSIAYVDMPAQDPAAQTLVFVHGLGSYLKFWRSQIDAFHQQGYRVVALDLPGYGKSDKPATFPYTMEAMADVVLELVNGLDVRKPVLVGHSMGGQTALSYAIRYPDALGALVLVSPAGFEKFSWKEKAWFERSVSSDLIKAAPESAIWGSVRQANFMNWRPGLDWLIEERVRLAKTPEFDAYAYANVRSINGLAHDDFVRDNLDRIQVPTLIIYGTDDRLIPSPFMHAGETRDIMEYGASHIPGSKLEGLKGCGHTVQLDCAERFNPLLSAFLREKAPRADSVAPASTTPAPSEGAPAK